MICQTGADFIPHVFCCLHEEGVCNTRTLFVEDASSVSTLLLSVCHLIKGTEKCLRIAV